MTNFSRQTDIIHPDELGMTIDIAGAGGIGSWTAVALTRIGCVNLRVFDPDKIEEVNVPSQAYNFKEVGIDKVIALGVKLAAINPEISFSGSCSKYSPTGRSLPNILILAVDSMKERKAIYGMVKNTDIWIIDGRMGGEEFRIYTAKTKDYAKCLDYSGEETKDIPCSAKAIAYNTMIIGGLIASQVKRIAKKERVAPLLIGDLKTPFLMEGGI